MPDHPAGQLDGLAALGTLGRHPVLAVHQLLVGLQLLRRLEDLVEALALGAEEGVVRVRADLVFQLVCRQLRLAAEPFDALGALIWLGRGSLALLKYKSQR